jgi:hypothetical protein
MPRVTIEHKGTFIHVQVCQVAEVLQQLHGNPASNDLCTKSSKAANAMHSALLSALPQLQGKATSSFSTAIRTPTVRNLVKNKVHRGIEVDKLIRFVSAAADAQRHLTCQLIDEVVQLVTSTVNNIQVEHNIEVKSVGYKVICEDESIEPCSANFSDITSSPELDHPELVPVTMQPLTDAEVQAEATMCEAGVQCEECIDDKQQHEVSELQFQVASLELELENLGSSSGLRSATCIHDMFNRIIECNPAEVSYWANIRDRLILEFNL